MKKGILLLLLVSSVFAHAQSLKDALYGGKLKNDPGTVIRKGDDLASKMDTTRKVAIDETGKAKAANLTSDASAKRTTNQTDSAVISTTSSKDNITSSGDTAANTSTDAAPKNNNIVWKTYMDSAISTLKTETLPSKKIKRGTYYATVSYTIGTDGQVAIGDVFLSPENAYLQQRIKERLDLDTPRLNPALSGSGTPRKVSKKYNFTLSKE